jgi:hypothetical protein
MLDRTSPIDIDKNADTEFVNTIVDSNLGDFENKVGMVGGVGIGTAQKANYINYNEDKQVEREWGFERLLHEERDVWEIEKPYMNFYRPNFKCYVTADIGNVRVETAVGRSTPKDATFTGNVVVHIVPEGSGGIKESHIYLDDIVFLSERSQLSTSGPVEFVSEDVRMLGTGMELIYNDQLKRLEYLRIFELESLRGKSSQMSLSSSEQKQPAPASTGRVPAAQTSKPVVAKDLPETQVTAIPPQGEQKQGEYYKCVFNKNVVIDSPEQLVFAGDRVCINDIFWSKASENRSSQTNVQASEQNPQRVEQNRLHTEQSRPGAKQNRRSEEQTTISNVPPAGAHDPNTSSEETVVTCDGGFVVVPVNSARSREILGETGTGMEDIYSRLPDEFNHLGQRTALIAGEINYNASTGGSVVNGASELKFYTTDVFRSETETTSVPVSVTSQQRVRFSPASNQVIFEGNCLCIMQREDPNFNQTYTLSAPKLTIDLLEDANGRPSESAAKIKHFTAEGGLARLRSLKKAGKELLNGIELEAVKFDYDPAQGLFIATGPGVIQVNNSKVTDTGADKFSLRKPCYAFLREFDTLKYFFEKNQIIADAPSPGLLIDYFPVVDGQAQYDRQATFTAPHVQANLAETPEGHLKLSTFSTTGGIVYRDEQDKNFDGSKLFYDADKSLVTVRGDESLPCHFNGASVDAIEWNLKTDRFKFEITAPGAL